MNKKLIAAPAAAVLLAGCSGAPTRHSQPPTVPPAASSMLAVTIAPAASVKPMSFYAHQYTAIVAAANAADARFADAVNKTGATAASVQPAASAAAAAVRKTDNQLLRVDWPTSKIRADVEAMVRVDATLAGDLDDVADHMNDLDPAGSAAQGAANIVRADLGLPPGGS